MPTALLVARREGSRQCRRGQCLGRQGCPAVGPGCRPGRGWAARSGRGHVPASPRQEPGAISNVSFCCSRVFPFISVLLPVKVKFISNGNPHPLQGSEPPFHPEVSWAVCGLIFNLFAANSMALGPVPPLRWPRSRAGTWHDWARLPSSNAIFPFPARPLVPNCSPLSAGGGCPHPWARRCLPARHPSPPTLQLAPSE